MFKLALETKITKGSRNMTYNDIYLHRPLFGEKGIARRGMFYKKQDIRELIDKFRQELPNAISSYYDLGEWNDWEVRIYDGKVLAIGCNRYTIEDVDYIEKLLFGKKK